MHLHRVFGFLLLTALSFDAVQAQESAPPDYGLTRHPGESRLPGSSYRLTLVRAEPDKNHGRMGIFRFRHSLDHRIRLWGFGFEKDGSLRTRFERFARMEAGQWREVSVGYCGTGAETFEVAPDRDYLLRVPLWPFVKEGAQGVVALSMQPNITIVSDVFDGEAVRNALHSFRYLDLRK